MKTNDCEATLRKGNLPKAEEVKTLSVTGTDEVREKCVKQQIERNMMKSDNRDETTGV